MDKFTADPRLNDLISAADYARLHGISPITLRQRCARGSIPGAVKIGTYPHQVWLIPKDAKCVDKRIRTGKYIGAKRARKKPPEKPEE